MPDSLLLCVSFGDEVAPFSADTPVHEVAEFVAVDVIEDRGHMFNS